MKIFKILLKITLIISLFVNSAGQGYALRPVSTKEAETHDLLAPFGHERVYIDKEKVQKWIDSLSTEMKNLSEGKEGRYPLSFHAIKEMLAALSHLPHNETSSFLTGMGLDMREAVPEKRGVRFKQFGIPQRIVEARFLRIRSKKFPRYLGKALFKDDEAVVPFFGSFYRPDGTEISDSELLSIGLEWLKDKDGSYLTFPYFATEMFPSRKMTYALGKQFTRIARYKGKIHILSTIKDYEDFISKELLDKEILPVLKAQARQHVEEDDTSALRLNDKVIADYIDDAYLTLMCNYLIENKHSLKMYTVAFQYKGFGGMYYCHRLEPMPETLPPHLSPVKITISDDDQSIGVMVSDERFKGKAGIILYPYQPSNVAIGGSSTEEEDAVKRDRELMNNGATLSTINLDTIEILSKKQLRRLEIDENLRPVIGAIRIVVDDTRSFDETLKFNTYKNFLKREFGEDFEKAKDRHFKVFCGTLARNIAACLKSRLTIPRNDLGVLRSIGILRNVSPLGSLRDTGDLARIKNPFDAMIILKSAMDGLLILAEKAGMSKVDFLKSRYLDQFINATLTSTGTVNETTQGRLDLIATAKKSLKETAKDEDIDMFIATVIALLFDHWRSVFGIEDIDKHVPDFISCIKGEVDMWSLAFSVMLSAPIGFDVTIEYERMIAEGIPAIMDQLVVPNGSGQENAVQLEFKKVVREMRLLETIDTAA